MGDFVTYFMWLLAIIAVFTLIRVLCSCICSRMSEAEPNQTGIRRRVVRRIRIDPPQSTEATTGAVFENMTLLQSLWNTPTAASSTSTNKSDDNELVEYANPIAYIVGMMVIMMLYLAIVLLIVFWKKLFFTSNDNERDRQGNVFTIHDEASRESRYNDIFYIEPNSVEAARIRSQLDKDDKDLPTYEDVIRMTSLDQQAPMPATVAALTASNASVNTTDTILPVPPYSEVDPYASTSRLANDTPPVIPGNPIDASSASVPLASVVVPIHTPIAATHSSSNV